MSASKCMSCEHLAYLQDAVEGRGITYIGVCAHPDRTAVGRTNYCAATENFASACQQYKSSVDAAIERALAETEDA